MRKGLVYILCFVCTMSAQAKTASMFELSAGGAWSRFGYQLTTINQPLLTVSQPGSYGWCAHAGYGLMLNTYVGLGLGVDMSRYGSTVQLSGLMQYPGVADSEGEVYDRTTNIHSWQDKQEVYMLEVPLSLYVRVPLQGERTSLTASLGAKVGFPLMSKASYRAKTSDVGFYEAWQLRLQDIPEHGFGSSDVQANYVLNPKMGYAAFLKLGFETSIARSRTVWFFTQAYANYYFTSILDTDLVSGPVRPLHAGLELGFRFRLSHRKHYECRCVR